MSLRDERTPRVAVYEGAGSEPLESSERFTAITTLLENGLAVSRVTEAAELAPELDTLLVIGRFGNGIPPELGAARFHNLTAPHPAGISAAVETACSETGTALSSTVGSEAWNSRDLKSRPH